MIDLFKIHRPDYTFNVQVIDQICSTLDNLNNQNIYSFWYNFSHLPFLQFTIKDKLYKNYFHIVIKIISYVK